MVDQIKVNKLKKQLSEIFSRYGVKLVYFFGSQYAGHPGPLSDLDLAVLWDVSEKTPMLQSLALQDEVAAKLNDSSVEIGPLNGQNTSFMYTVIAGGICIYGQEEDRVRYETRVLNEYLDFSYLADAYNRAFYQSVSRR
jgi:predicted nucleotidyltransferase